MTRLRVLHSYLYVPVPIFPNALQYRTTVCTGARCVRVPESTNDTRTGLYQHRTSAALHSYEYENTNTLLVLPYEGARCVRVPEIIQHTRTDSYHRPNKTRGSYYAMTLLLYCTSTALVPVRTGTNIPGRATTVCTGARCVRVPESTIDTRTDSYHHPNITQGSYHAMSPRQRVLHSSN